MNTMSLKVCFNYLKAVRIFSWIFTTSPNPNFTTGKSILESLHFKPHKTCLKGRGEREKHQASISSTGGGQRSTQVPGSPNDSRGFGCTVAPSRH